MPDNNHQLVDTTKEKDLKGKFKKIGEQIARAFVDFTTLNVTTLSGDVRHIIKTKPNGKTKFDFTDVLKSIGDEGETQSEVYVVAHTHVAFDHDTVNFIKEDLSTDDVKLLKFHISSIESAQVARKSFLNFIKTIK